MNQMVKCARAADTSNDPSRSSSSAKVGTNGVVLKGTAGRLYRLDVVNVAATAYFLMVFDKATAPAVSYHVTLATPSELAVLRYSATPQAKLVWTDEENGQLRRYNLDPGAGFYRNALTGLFLLLPVDEQL